MAILFLVVGMILGFAGFLVLFTGDCFDEVKTGSILIGVGIVLLIVPAMVPANEEIINCQVITTSMDINGEKILTDTPVKWTWKERSVNHFSYAFLKDTFFDYKVEVAE